jgi:hypothetical protein
MAAAEDMVRVSEEWKSYVKKMHEARHAANLARADWRGLERDYFDNARKENAAREEMKMARG